MGIEMFRFNMSIILTKRGINIEMENVTMPEMLKLRDYFTQLIQLQIHRFKNGKVILHFDNKGDLMKIDIEKIAWKRERT